MRCACDIFQKPSPAQPAGRGNFGFNKHKEKGRKKNQNRACRLQSPSSSLPLASATICNAMQVAPPVREVEERAQRQVGRLLWDDAKSR